jgi:predicted transposase/invertase (TIGR01784 family)
MSKNKNYYESQQKFWLDQNAFIKETIDKAVEQAELSKQFEIGKNLVSIGLENSTIAKATGLTIKQIEQLRTGKQ